MSGPGPVPPELAGPLSRASDRLGPFSTLLVWYSEVPSTNDVAGSLAERGAPEGAVVVADAQSAGRGRHGRAWASPPGAGLYVSTVLRPGPHAVPLLTIAAGVALAEGIQRATGLRLDLKWPNDICAGSRKVAGVLAEASSTPDRVSRRESRGTMRTAGDMVVDPSPVAMAVIQHVVLGFGINVLPAAYPADIAARATSLETELGRPVDRGLVLAECLAGLAQRYDDLRCGHVDRVLEGWRSRASALLGRRVRWDGVERLHEGVALDIDADGALLVRVAGGALARITASAVTWL